MSDFHKPGTTRVLSAALIGALLLASCRFNGLSLKQDARVDIVFPQDRSEVELPMNVQWKAEGFTGSYAVFVDRAPQPPRETVRSLFKDDQDCQRRPDCPDAPYLAAQNIYLTGDRIVSVSQIPDLEGREFHELTIVLLDEGGRRLNESAFAVEFRVRRT